MNDNPSLFMLGQAASYIPWYWGQEKAFSKTETAEFHKCFCFGPRENSYACFTVTGSILSVVPVCFLPANETTIV